MRLLHGHRLQRPELRLLQGWLLHQLLHQLLSLSLDLLLLHLHLQLMLYFPLLHQLLQLPKLLLKVLLGGIRCSSQALEWLMKLLHH